MAAHTCALCRLAHDLREPLDRHAEELHANREHGRARRAAALGESDAITQPDQGGPRVG